MARRALKDEAKLNIDKIVSFVEFHHSKPFPRFKEQLLDMASEYCRTPEMFFIADGELVKMLSKKCKSDKY